MYTILRFQEEKRDFKIIITFQKEEKQFRIG